MGQYWTAKPFEQQLREEKEKLLAEVNEAVKKKLAMIMPISDNELLK